ncbi:hypothetical protein, partial [Cellulophaga baltica]|uniref:hypothetical protein n=1 Tax=Cellulophaga baltica TaxID=76594 RepID=UPI00055727F4
SNRSFSTIEIIKNKTSINQEKGSQMAPFFLASLGNDIMNLSTTRYYFPFALENVPLVIM